MTIRVERSFRDIDDGKKVALWAFQFKTFVLMHGIDFSVVYFINDNKMLEHCICLDHRKSFAPADDLMFYDCGYKDFSGRVKIENIDKYTVPPDNICHFLLGLIIKRSDLKNGTVEWQSEPQ